MAIVCHIPVFVEGRDQVEQVVTRRRPRLAQIVVDELRRRIASGALPVGSQLPTEPQLEQQFEVSRTVVREAIAELRASGLVTPIQGKGIFVSEQTRPAMIDLTPGEIQSIPQTLEMLEFRMAIETEAAAIAAYRRSAEQENAIRAAHHDMANRVIEDRPTTDADFAFHLAIGAATNNRFFIDGLKRFGPASIPRSQFPTLPSAKDPAYLAGVVAEHERILDAIADQDPDAARLSMREHLLGSQKRYRRLAR
ncbi:FadR family transcriptional regulator [Devosia sp. BK]|uniref:FadR/GntR family transcriptional regulator n=1 Tax=Devosia sp. Leaf64 TaxID=1736229 RepID=UPI000715B6F6|nr:FadR/GntR family transcriptional regulator [Devosia sp. Leaf64]KQN75268.1 GntR family transcriptional regulator [Devosia sp. Leaf64]MDV3253239.1 FadR family transcriptional regulator [Devosia sp. BK]